MILHTVHHNAGKIYSDKKENALHELGPWILEIMNYDICQNTQSVTLQPSANN